MSLIEYYEQPELRDPVVIVAFGGWNDAADAATTAIKYLIDHWKPVKLAEIDSEDFFVFTETRPSVKLVEGMQRTLVWPTNQFLAYEAPDLNRDVILFLGVEPQLKWKTFSKAFLEVCQKFHASEVVFLGALLADVPHSVTVPITGSSPDEVVLERLREMDIRGSKYEGPTGMLGVLHDICKSVDIQSASMWAAAPHYLAATPNIKVTAALLTNINQFLSLGLDLSEILTDAARFEEQVTALVARDPEASEYVRKLEERVANGLDDDEDEDEDFFEEFGHVERHTTPGTGPLPSADSLIRDVEELLRKNRENIQPDTSDEDDDGDDEENE
ncbi:MAG TPA: PAC2 family protein [Dictyobacter sp.]|nr:PAC2 family protein [Dictyobacter sp.]